MAINRSQIPSQIDIFPTAGEEYLKMMGSLASKPITETDLKSEAERLSFLLPPERNANFYDLASELGAGLLSTPNIGGASAFVGLGVGFSNFNEGLKKRQQARDKFKQQMKLMAYQTLEKRRAAQLSLRQEAGTMDFKIKLEAAKNGSLGLFGGLNTPEGRALDFVLQAQNDPTLKDRDPNSYNAAVKILSAPQYVQTLTEAGIVLQPVPGKLAGIADITEVGDRVEYEGVIWEFTGGDVRNKNNWKEVTE